MTLNQKFSGLLARVLLRVLPVATLVIFLIGLATSMLVERSFKQQIQLNLEKDARFGADITASKLDTILGSIRSVAANDLVINGLVDTEAREAYVPLYFNQLQFSGFGKGSKVSFTDYRGRLIASNWSGADILGAEWLQSVIENGHEYIRLNEYGGVFVVPVFYEGTPEGAIVVEVSETQLAKFMALSLGTNSVAVRSSNGELYSSDKVFSKVYSSGADVNREWFQSTAIVSRYKDVNIIVAKRRLVALASVYELERSLYVAIAFALAALAVGIFSAAFMTTSPLSKFAAELKKFGAARDLNRRIVAEGTFEFHDLANSFNSMLERMQKTVVSHEQLASEAKIRQGAEFALQEQNERFNVALENMTHGLCVFDKDNQLVVSNERYATMYGISTDFLKPGITAREIVEQRIENGIFAGESLDDYIQDRITWGNNSDDSEAKVQELSDGRTIRISREPLSDGGWVTTHEDITEIKRMERLERDQNERFSVALENMSQGLSVFDNRQQLVICNERYATMYRLSPEQVKPGTPLNEIIEHRISNGFYAGESPEQYIEERHMWALDSCKKEKVQEFSDGRTIRVSREALSDGGWVATHEDITESMRMERLKNEFVSVVSHELRTPLTSLSGSLSLLNSDAMGTLPDQAKSLLDIANRNTKRLTLLVNDILDMEKIKSDSMDFNLTPTDTVALAQWAIDENSAYGLENGVRFRLEQAVESAYAKVDENRMMQVLTNLLSNAAKFSSPDSEVILRISKENSKIRYAVIDTGCGIPKDKQSLLFERFFQVDGSDARGKRGTGLGLAVVKAIVEKHGSRIQVESEVGNGSTFFFDVDEVEAGSEMNSGLVKTQDAAVA